MGCADVGLILRLAYVRIMVVGDWPTTGVANGNACGMKSNAGMCQPMFIVIENRYAVICNESFVYGLGVCGCLGLVCCKIEC